MILVIGGVKGGSGKTTVAINLAVMRSLAGFDVLLIDADDQESASDFTALRNKSLETGAGYTCIKLTDANVRTETKRLVDKYDDILIDTGGRDTTSQRAALTIANVLIVPFVPRSLDIWTLDKVSKLIEEIQAVNPNLTAYGFINRADPRGQDNQEAEDILKDAANVEFIDYPLVSRKAFGNATSAGAGVVELKPQDEKATEEIKSLYKYIFDRQ
jgi:chromosome partitioning protein